MSDFIDTLKSFSVHAESSIDSFRGDGQKIKLHRGIDIYVKRPDRLRADVDGDFLDQQLFYDGKTITYGSDTELAAAITDLEARLARAEGTPRRRRWGTSATKGL